MLGWTLVFALLAFIAGALGFFTLAGVAADIAQVLCLLFLGLLVVSYVIRALKGRSVT